MAAVTQASESFTCEFTLKSVEPSPTKKPRSAGLFHERRLKGNQSASAAKARAVMSSTLPVPLMARYLGAAAVSALAQLA
jgi:hypothetical protein